MPLSYEDFGVEPDSGFNLEAANAVHDIVMDMDDATARGFLRVLAFDGITSDIVAHRDEIQNFVDNFYDHQTEIIKSRMASTYVEKRLAGEDTESLIAAATAIRKAAGDNFEDYTPEERRAAAGRQYRDASGRWIDMNRTIQYNTRDAKMSHGAAQSLGVKPPGKGFLFGNTKDSSGLSGSDQIRYREAYLQVHDFLNKELNGIPADDSIVQFHYKNGRGESLTSTHAGSTSADAIDPKKFDQGGKLHSVSVKVNPDVNVRGTAFNVISAIGGGRTAAHVTSLNPEQVGERLGTFQTEWNSRHNSDIGNNDRVYRRLSAGAGFLEKLVPESALKTKLALAAGKWLGEYGPQAEKVIGPTARLTAYRYRGIERKPDENVVSRVENSPRNAIIFPTVKELPDRNGNLRTYEQESPIIEYFTARLPKMELYELQRKAGTIPPSEGIVIDRKGRVVTQAVGYGDDWYLPFNLKNVGQLNGGEYIRTRAIGGLTTEDVYTGLVSGARRVTVVSRSGVFTMEFDENFRGTRRYSDKAARMVSRYGHLLDAIDKGNIIPGSIPDDRMQEIRSEALRKYDESDVESIKAYIEQAKVREAQSPKLSRFRTDTIRSEVLAEAAGRMKTPSGMPMTIPDMLAESVAAERKKYPEDQRNSAIVTARIRNMYGDDVAMSTTLGLENQVQERIETARREYARSMRPLKLDGNGYNYAAQALREQFPYYIKDNVRFRDTPNINGIAQGTPDRDAGYVMANHIRPREALTGYYDTEIAGVGTVTDAAGKPTGKIYGHQSMYQNSGRGVDTGQAARSEKYEDTSVARPAQASPTPEQPTQASGDIRRVILAQKIAADLQKQDTVYNFLKKENITGVEQKVIREKFDAIGTPVDEIAEKWRDPAFRTRFESQVKELLEYRELPNMDMDMLEQFKGGRLEKKKIQFSIDDAFLDSKTEFDGLPDDYKEGHPSTAYEDAYNSGRMKAARERLGLSDVGIDDPRINDAVNGSMEQMKNEWVKYLDYLDRRKKDKYLTAHDNPIRNIDDFRSDVYNNILLRTVVRRHGEAVKVEAAAAVATPPGIGLRFNGDNQLEAIGVNGGGQVHVINVNAGGPEGTPNVIHESPMDDETMQWAQEAQKRAEDARRRLGQ